MFEVDRSFFMTSEYEGRRVVVTGGTGFLGSAVVAALLDSGATCEVPWHTDAELARSPFRHHQRVRLRQLDVSSEQAVAAFYAGLADLWASVHTVGGFAAAPVADTPAADFRRMFDANAVSCFLCCREAVRAIRRTAGQSGGRIVNVAARPALVPTGGMIAYSTAKAAVASITQCLAEELKREDILVNAVVPSLMDTAANRRAMPDADYSQWPKVEQVAQAVAFLASPRNSLTSGTLLPVYGRA
jgi:NAD(P)-dependent dehydrogenase (short-subunit alcohol dehydrogenase family)